MAYDYPYRLIKTVNVRTNGVAYVIERTSIGIICEGDDFNEMRHLVDCANQAHAAKQAHVSQMEKT